MVDISRLSTSFGMCYIVSCFVDSLNGEVRQNHPDLFPVLKQVSDLFSLYHMERDLGDYTEDGYLSSEQTAILHAAVRDLLRSIRPQAVALVDAFDVSDFTLNSALGRYDGQGKS